MTRLVAVGILADKSGHIQDLIFRGSVLGKFKKLFKPVRESRLAAESLNQPFRIVHYMPRILPGVPLRKTRALTLAERIERIGEVSVGVLRTHKHRLSVKKIAPDSRALSIQFLHFLIADRLGETCRTGVIIRALQRTAHALVLDKIGRIITEPLQHGPSFLQPGMLVRQRAMDKSHRFLHVKIWQKPL